MKIAIALALLFVVLATGLQAHQVPVKVTFRRGLNPSSPSMVAQFTNLSDTALAVRVRLQRFARGESRMFSFTLSPGGWKEIGRSQGWIVRSRDEVTVAADGFGDYQCRVP